MDSPFDPFSYDLQPNDAPVFDDSLENIFNKHLLELEQALQPQETQNQLNEALDDDMQAFMQNMITTDTPTKENTQPLSLTELLAQEIEPLPVEQQHASPDSPLQGNEMQFETTKSPTIPSQEVSQQEPPQVREAAPQSQVQEPSKESPQQAFQPDPFTVQNDLLCENLQLRKEIEALRSQVTEAKKNEQGPKKSTPSLRLRMRIQPDSAATQTIKNADVQRKIGELQPTPQQIQSTHVKDAASNPLTDLFGHSSIMMPSFSPQTFEAQMQPEQAYDRNDSNAYLPFWEVGNPSHTPSHDFHPEKSNEKDLLEVLNTNLFAHEINAMDPEVSNDTRRSKAGNKKSAGNSLVNAIARPSDVPQPLMRAGTVTADMTLHEVPPNLPDNEAGQQKLLGKRNIQPNDQEPRKRTRVFQFPDGINNDNDEDENDGGDPDYMPEEENGTLEELPDNLFASDRPVTVNGSQQNIMEGPSVPPQSAESSDDESLHFEEFEPGLVTCPKCKDIFANSDSLERHFRLVHSKAKGKVHTCQECRLECRNEQNLRRHWNNAHGGDLNFSCDVCGARFCTKRSLSLHRTKQHPDVYKPLSKRKKKKFHECKLCDYTSDQSYNVVRHVFTKHTDKVAAECPHGCGKTFKSKSNAKVHFSKCKFR